MEVIPAEKSPYNTQKSIPLIDVVPENSSSVTSDDEVPLQFAWDVVRGKLTDSLTAINKGVKLSERLGKLEQNPSKQASSLCAIAEGPRIRLMWISLKWLNKEDLLPLAEKNLIGYDSIIQNIRKLGKDNLYAELVYALRFGSSRKGGYYNGRFFMQNEVSILEDLLITLADGIASMYLELISVDSSLCNEMNNLGLSLCTLSTRSLQRLRNEACFYLLLFSHLVGG